MGDTPKKKIVGSKKSIYVKDKNDPRYRAYQDSLLLHNLSEKQRLKGTNNKENIFLNKKGSDVLDESERKWYQDTRKQLKGKFFPNSEVTIKIQGGDDRKRPNSKENDYNNDEYFHPDIKPIKGYNWSTETGITRLLESNDNFLYKKPQQRILVQTSKSSGKPELVKVIKKVDEPLKETPQVQQINQLTPASINNSNNIQSDTNITTRAEIKTPKRVKVVDKVNQKFGGSETSYEIPYEQLKDQPEMKGKNTRTVTPIYMKGGRLPSTKRHIDPGLIMSGVGIATNLVSSILEKEAAKKAKIAAEDNMFKEQALQDQYALDNYAVRGNNVDMYADGGELPMKSTNPVTQFNYKGGQLKPLASDTAEVQGNSHGSKAIDGQYGVTLQDKQTGEEVAEVEGGEVIKDNFVTSNRLMYDKKHSFADKLKQLATKRGKLEKELDKNSKPIKRNTIERQLAGLNMAEDVLMEKQEQVKQMEGEKELAKLDTAPVMAMGGRMPSKKRYIGGTKNLDLKGGYEKDTFLEKAAPYIDNAVNLIDTLTAPKLATPVMNRAANLETTVNVNPQLARIKRGVNTANKNILDNTSNSNVARANMTAARLNGVTSEAEALAGKETQEIALRNQDAMNKQGVNTSNTAMVNQHAMNEFTRQGDLRSQINANAANLEKDFKTQQERDDKRGQNLDTFTTTLRADASGSSAQAVLQNPNSTPEQIEIAKNILQSLGKYKINEGRDTLINKLTPISNTKINVPINGSLINSRITKRPRMNLMNYNN